MAVVWNPIGAIGVVASILVWCLSGAVYFTNPGRPLNRRLGLFMAVEGVFVAGLALSYMRDDASGAYAWRAVHMLALLALPWLYFRVLAMLDTPLVRPWKHAMVERALVVAALVSQVLWFRWPHWFVAGMVDTLAVIPWLGAHGPVYKVALQSLGLVFLYGFVASVSAYLRAPSDTATRQRAKAFAVAFGVRDLLYVIHFFVVVPMFWRWPDLAWVQAMTALAVPTITSVYVVFVAYGILKTQLFDIDLRIKWGIRRGTLAGVFLAFFLAAVEVAQNLANDSFGLFVGGVATAVLLLAIRPLERLADRVSEVAMPHVQDTEAYLVFRKLEVYKETLEGVLADGEMSPKDQEVLQRLRGKLGIAEAVAVAMERDVRAAWSAPG